MIGIYQISNKINGKRYIGSSNNIKRRFYKWAYGSVETNRDECNGVGVNLSHVEARGIRKDEDIVQTD
jgi:predicted GIY-YIG superfamily endonuclease